MKSMITKLWRDQLDVIFPRSCVHCSGLLTWGFRHLCLACAKLLLVVEPPHCTTCGYVAAYQFTFSAFDKVVRHFQS